MFLEYFIRLNIVFKTLEYPRDSSIIEQIYQMFSKLRTLEVDSNHVKNITDKDTY